MGEMVDFARVCPAADAKRPQRALYADLRAREVSTSGLRLLRTALSALFTTGVLLNIG